MINPVEYISCPHCKEEIRLCPDCGYVMIDAKITKTAIDGRTSNNIILYYTDGIECTNCGYFELDNE